MFGVTLSNETTVNVFTGMGYDDMTIESLEEASSVLDLSDEELSDLNAKLMDPNAQEDEKEEAKGIWVI